MQPVCFKDRAVLVRIRQGYGSSDDTELSTRNIRCSLSEPNLSRQIETEGIGRKADLSMLCYKRDFDADVWTHADIKGVRYLIRNIGPGFSGLVTEVLLERM